MSAKEGAVKEDQKSMEHTVLDCDTALENILQGVPLDVHETVKRGLRALLRLKAEHTSLSTGILDYYISQIDKKLSDQVNAIMHHPTFMSLEATWRNVQFLVERVDVNQGVYVDLISASKEDVLRDFQDCPEVVTSGLYHHIYTAEFGQFGGSPVAAIVADYTFGSGPDDIQLLTYISAVCSMAHAPFFAAASKEFFDLESWGELSGIVDIQSLFDMPRYARWNAFRDNPNARYIGLTLPGFLLRLPFVEGGGQDKRVGYAGTSFGFTEQLHHEDFFCWGNVAFAFAVVLAESFSKYRWCVNIVGPDGGGLIDNLTCTGHEALQGIQKKYATRTLFTEKREFELANLGFIPLSSFKETHEAVFFSANSVLRAKKFPDTEEGNAAEISFRLSTQFPYMMLMNRLAHYIKVLQRENTGLWREQTDLNRELNAWISQYVTAMDTPDIVTRSKRPLRMAQIHVNEIPGNSGWYSIKILVRPHFKYLGVDFTLALEGKLERQSYGESPQTVRE